MEVGSSRGGSSGSGGILAPLKADLLSGQLLKEGRTCTPLVVRDAHLAWLPRRGAGEEAVGPQQCPEGSKAATEPPL